MSWLFSIPPQLLPIWEQIEDGQIELAIQNLRDYSKGINWKNYKETLIYSCQLYELKNLTRSGIITRVEYCRELNMIIDSFIETLKQASSKHKALPKQTSE